MIQRIGVLCQDKNSLGFLLGLKRRLNWGEAEVIEPDTGGLAKSLRMSSRQAKLAWRDLSRKQVDLLVRFTDSDGIRFQDVERGEIAVFPNDSRGMVIVGVAVENVEDWLGLHREYIAGKLQLDPQDISGQDACDVIKGAIKRSQPHGIAVSEYVANLVHSAPQDIFRHWLQQSPSLRKFYMACRSSALAANCGPVPNELDAA